MMKEIDYFRAKSKDEKNFLLKDHLKETIERAVQLKKFIEKNEETIKYPKFNEEFFEKLIIACFLHDLGKIEYNFQKKIFDGEEFNQIKSFFNSFFSEYRNIDIKDHEVISVIFSSLFLDNDCWAKKIRTAILLHHYNEFYVNKVVHIANIFSEHPELEKYVEFLSKSKNKIEQLLKDLLEYLLQTITDQNVKTILCNLKNNINFYRLEELGEGIKNGFGLSTKLKLLEIPDKENDDFYEFFVFLGCLRRCDYSASGDTLIEKESNISDVFKELENEVKRAIEKITGRKLEIWQEELLRNKNLKNKNVVLIAPTGSGKTEFALLWAKENEKKLIYTLPLRVALNDLFDRFRKDNNKLGYFDKKYVDILHSTSFLEYLKEEKEGKALDIDEQITSAHLFSSPIMLTTPDQALLSSLKFYGFDKLISIYPVSSIIIDEVQAYKPEMAAVIIKTIEIIKSLTSNVLIITATFPPYFEEFIKKDEFEILDLENEKNRLKCKIKNYELKRHKIKLIDGAFKYERGKGTYELRLEKILNELKKLIKTYQNKNILIVVNNVGKAIKLFKELEADSDIKARLYLLEEKEEIPLLLHSRIIEKEKSKRIFALKNALENKKSGMILIATQIIEASVNIDFDVLITEISPIDSQIQRWGRIYRNRDREGDYQENAPNIFIFIGEKENGERRIDEGTSAIYDKEVIIKTIEILRKQNLNEVFDYEKERKLIKTVFEDNNEELKRRYVEEIKKNLEWLKFYSVEKKSEAQRIFRRIAGIQVIILDLMMEGDDVEKALYEVIKDKKNWRLPIESEKGDCILKKVKEKLSDQNKNQINRWKILEILYSYSFNLPIFRLNYIKNNFKGFFIIKDLSNVQEIRKLGINKIEKDIDIDSLEIEEETII